MKDRKIKSLVQMGILCGLAFVFILLVRFPIFPATPYLIYDAGDIPLLIGSMMFGPLAGFAMTAVVSGLQAVFLSGDGIVGFLMHLIASGTMVLIAGGIYKKFHNRKGAGIGLIVGTLARAAVMIPSNLIFTVHFYGVPQDVVIAALPFTIAFNLIVGGINSGVVFFIYKPLSRFFKKEKPTVTKNGDAGKVSQEQ